MKPEQADRARQLFDQALDLADPAERAGYLKGACGGDAELLAHVQKLLAAHVGAEAEFPTDPADAATLVDDTAVLAEGPGTQIGRYKLLEQIGEGGMGVVYMAEQREPFHKRVALKVIKLGMDTKAVVARFNAEYQALALMNHPSIAKVLDAGATDSGRPFFVMEYIRGIPITQYCDEKKLSTRQRLELFIPVCQAVQHAHQKGIIHRDLKPSNVLVASFDGRSVPMIIDFGIAKAVNQRLGPDTFFTRHGQFIGTLEYIAPEQAEGSQLDVDTRADIYSLGVLLYQLLTGTTPFPGKRLRESAWRETMRIIQEEEPELPSHRLSTLTAEQGTTIEQTHGGEGPRKISLVLRRELDLVVMGCLEKDRNRRYETANALAKDLERYLQGEAVSRVPPTVGYQVLKLVRKHKKTAAMAAAIAVILAGATAFSTWQMVRAKKAEMLAESRAEETLQQKAATDTINGWMRREVLGLLDAWGAEAAPGRADIRLREVLAQATTNLATQFKDQPVIEAEIRYAIGQSLRSMEQNEPALENLLRAYELFQDRLGPGHTNTIIAQTWAGWLMSWQVNGGRLPRQHAAKANELMETGYRAATNHLGSKSEEAAMAAALLGLAFMNQGNLERAAEWLPIAPAILGPLPAPANSPYSDHIWHAAHWTHAAYWRNRGAASTYKNILEALWQNDSTPRPERDNVIRPTATFARLHDEMAGIHWHWYRNPHRAEQLLTNGLAMAHHLVGSGHPTDNLVHSLLHLYDDSDRVEDAARMIEEELLQATRQLKINYVFPINLRFQAVNLHGLRGDWPAVLEVIDAHRKAGLGDGNTPTVEVMAEYLVNGGDRYREVRQRFWRQSLANPEAYKVPAWDAKTMLSLPCPPDETNHLNLLVERGLADAPADGSVRPTRTILLGLHAYRTGDLAATTNLLASISRGYPFVMDQPLATYFQAMAEHELGQRLRSRQTLERANRWLDGNLRRGKLTARRWRWNGAQEFGALIAVRREAENMVLKQTSSPAVGREQMAAGRRTWAAIDKLIDEGDWAARQRNYAGAVAHYRTARAQENFSMEAAHFDSGAFDRMLFAEIMIGDAEACAGLVPLLHSPDHPIPEETLKLLLMLSGGMPTQLQEWIDRSMATHGLEAKWEASPKNRPQGFELTLALHWMRNGGGRVSNAIAPLEAMTRGVDLVAATTGAAYLALAQHRLGKTEEAQFSLAKARDGFNEHWVKHSPDLYQPDWVHAAMVELAVKEASQEIEAK